MVLGPGRRADTRGDDVEFDRSASNSRQGKNQGFLLQVEGALIDKRSHANDAAQTLEETKAFDEAVRRAVDFAKSDGNTLVIVTADHECAGFNIVGKGSFTNAEAGAPPYNNDAGNPANDSTPARHSSAGANVKDPARSTGPVNATGSDAKNFAPATFRTPDDPDSVTDGSPEASLWLTYLSGNHTGQNVQLFAYGREGEYFQNSFDNTDIYFKMRNALTALSSEGMSSASRASRPFAAAALVAAAAFLTGGCADSDPAEPQPSARKASPAATSAPASASAGPRRPPQRIDASAAAEGSIEIEDGPFTDRVKASDLELRGSRRPRISGRLLNLTDVSEVLLLELQADFYDRRGRYLGSGKQTFEEAEAFSETALRFDIAGGSQPRPASAAILTVPALVNE